MPFELPAVTSSLITAMEKLAPDELKRRKEEDAEQAQEGEQTCRGGFKPWEHVAAASDISFGHILCVSQGTPGIVVGNCSDDRHLTVKFDRREDDSDLCVDVLPSQLMKPLPGNFRLGQKVMACVDLELDDEIVVPLGCTGTIVAPVTGSDDKLLVSFDERLDGLKGYMSVEIDLILPDRLLVGGFRLGEKVLSSSDLAVNNQVRVPTDTPGRVISEYSDTRLNIAFDVGGSTQNQESNESHCIFNVQPAEIRALVDNVRRRGEIVCAKNDLGTEGNILVLAGTRGTVHSYIDASRIVVAFEGNEERGTSPQLLTVSESSIEKASLAKKRLWVTLQQARFIAEEDAKRAFEEALLRLAMKVKQKAN
jgi:hypothetical protein